MHCVAFVVVFFNLSFVLTHAFSASSSRIRKISSSFEMSEGSMRRMVKQATSWCGLNGLMYTDGGLNWSHAPVSLSPNTFPRESFEYAADIQVGICVYILMYMYGVCMMCLYVPECGTIRWNPQCARWVFSR